MIRSRVRTIIGLGMMTSVMSIIRSRKRVGRTTWMVT